MPLQPSWGAVLQVTACRTPLSGSLHVKRRDGGRLSPCSHPLPRRGKGAARRGRVAVPSNVLGSLLHACSLLGCVMTMVGASSETKGRPLFPVFTYVSATDRLSLDGLPIGCLLDCWRLRLDFWRLRGQQLKPREVTQQNLGRGGWDGIPRPGSGDWCGPRWNLAPAAGGRDHRQFRGTHSRVGLFPSRSIAEGLVASLGLCGAEGPEGLIRGEGEGSELQLPPPIKCGALACLRCSSACRPEGADRKGGALRCRLPVPS